MADMLDTTNPIQWLAVLAPFTAVLPILYILYQSILPKPIPGIPYSKHAAKSIFGDIPDMKRELPVWLGPLTKPTVTSKRGKTFFYVEKSLTDLAL
ncbi:cytochrome P450 [Colletotrichum scovillei]|uniref:Cytochrome P450 n=1 Tax=Colletotrichum scovillei TaxID=1209932 RepID=A0A9P7UAS8_9PEZI|nr:cytochrome P450 [Colletotrichum scovillei]KAG7049057.1 cytochrome P450 [Colletotrichum scovillei]